MNLQHLEEQVATAEERALQLSLIGFYRLDDNELAEAWQNINNLSAQLNQHSCDKGHYLSLRVATVKAELKGLERHLGKGVLPPVAA